MPATFVFGLVFGWLMLRTNSIILAILGHSVNNLLVLLTVTYWQEINTYAIFLMEKKESLILSSMIAAFSFVLIVLLLSFPKLTRKVK